MRYRRRSFIYGKHVRMYSCIAIHTKMYYATLTTYSSIQHVFFLRKKQHIIITIHDTDRKYKDYVYRKMLVQEYLKK